MVSFANDVNGHTPLYYLAATLSANDGNGFQQLIEINSDTYAAYEATNLSNINIQDGAGNIITSWLESGETNASTSTVYWIKLPNGSITVVYFVFYGTSQNSKDNSVTGAEPNYTGTYGQYDNGANVFLYYQNIAGSSKPSNWTVTGTITYSNGATITDPLAFTSIISATAFNGTTATLDFYGYNSNSTMAARQGGMWNGAPAGAPPNMSQYGQLNGNPYGLSMYNGSNQATVNTSTNCSTTPYIFSLWQNSTASSANIAINYGTATSTTSDYLALTTTYFGMYQNAADTGTIFIQWVRWRTSPASYTMPTITWGSITPLTSSGSVLNYMG